MISRPCSTFLDTSKLATYLGSFLIAHLGWCYKRPGLSPCACSNSISTSSSSSSTTSLALESFHRFQNSNQPSPLPPSGLQEAPQLVWNQQNMLTIVINILELIGLTKTW